MDRFPPENTFRPGRPSTRVRHDGRTRPVSPPPRHRTRGLTETRERLIITGTDDEASASSSDSSQMIFRLSPIPSSAVGPPPPPKAQPVNVMMLRSKPEQRAKSLPIVPSVYSFPKISSRQLITKSAPVILFKMPAVADHREPAPSTSINNGVAPPAATAGGSGMHLLDTELFVAALSSTGEGDDNDGDDNDDDKQSTAAAATTSTTRTATSAVSTPAYDSSAPDFVRRSAPIPIPQHTPRQMDYPWSLSLHPVVDMGLPSAADYEEDSTPYASSGVLDYHPAFPNHRAPPAITAPAAASTSLAAADDLRLATAHPDADDVNADKHGGDRPGNAQLQHSGGSGSESIVEPRSRLARLFGLAPRMQSNILGRRGATTASNNVSESSAATALLKQIQKRIVERPAEYA